LEELAIIKAIQDNPHITQESLRSTIHKSIATVKRLTVALQEKGILERKKGKSNGE
jgi:DNA-binding MarR family transcriptional regulator